MTSNFLSKRKSGTTHCPSQQMLRRKRGDGESKRAEGLLLSSPSSLKVELTLYTGDFLFILRKLPEDALHQDEGEKHDMESGTQGIHIKNHQEERTAPGTQGPSPLVEAAEAEKAGPRAHVTTSRASVKTESPE